MTKLAANPQIVFRQEGDEALLFDPDTGEVLVLNGTAAFIYSLLVDRRYTEEEIVAQLLEEYDVSTREQAERDVDEFLHDLRGKNLLGEVV